MQSEGSICSDSPSSELDSSLEKWACDFCTYENFKASTRCCMCRSPRTPTNQLNFENQQNQNSVLATGRKLSSASLITSADIFKLGASVPSSSSQTQSPASVTGGGHMHNYNNHQKISQQSRSSSPLTAYIFAGQSDMEQVPKWACQSCTYLNWPRSLRCTQCLAPRRRVSPAVSRNSPMSPRSALASPASPPPSAKSNNTTDKLQICISNKTFSPCTTPPASSPSASPPVSVQYSFEALKISSPKVKNNKNKSSHDVRGSSPTPAPSITSSTIAVMNKWSCNECTYDNWPRANRCVMCGTSRSQNSNKVEDKVSREDDVTRPDIGRETPSPQGASYFKTAPTIKTMDSKSGNNIDYERRMRQVRRRLRDTDWNWLSACMGVVDGDLNPVEAYLNAGGDVTRKLTNPEVALLSRPNANIFEAGHTLVHLAIKLHREEILSKLLSQFDNVTGGGARVKCVPSYVAPDLASAIRRHISLSLRQSKGNFPCYFINEFATYTLPPEIEDLPPATQEQLYSELLDRDAQRELEEENPVINWSPEIRVRLGSRLHALWNRSAGDCLLDSVLQATWGIFDKDNSLRRAMADTLHEVGHIFYPRWREWEIQNALELDYTLDEGQLAEDWAGLLNLASQPGASLEQLHVFCLAHVLRRPIIVYGVKYVKSWRGENLGFAKFEGVYLPLLWDPSQCSTSPIALGYTRGHFCALVPPEPAVRPHLHCTSGCGRLGAATATSSSMFCCSIEQDVDEKSTFLPLTTSTDEEKQLLPIHFLSDSELGTEEMLLRQWLDVCVTESGLIVARQKVGKPPLLVAQMTEEWLNHYRKLAQSTAAPFASRTSSGSAARSIPGSNQCYSSDGDSDEE